MPIRVKPINESRHPREQTIQPIDQICRVAATKYHDRDQSSPNDAVHMGTQRSTPGKRLGISRPQQGTQRTGRHLDPNALDRKSSSSHHLSGDFQPGIPTKHVVANPGDKNHNQSKDHRNRNGPVLIKRSQQAAEKTPAMMPRKTEASQVRDGLGVDLRPPG